ncbi:S8 family serine peptidase, partial [Verrucomicrobiota bacterium]
GYRALGLPSGDYEVVAVPPLPYGSPPSSNLTVTADVANVDFLVDIWAMGVAPTSITAQVMEGREGVTNLTIRNFGTTDGHVSLHTELRSGIAKAETPPMERPIVNWAALDSSEYAPGRVLVAFKEGEDRVAFRQRVRAMGGRVVKMFRTVPGAVVEYPPSMAPAEAAVELSKDAAVEYVEPDYRVDFDRVPNDALFEHLYGMRNRRQTGGTLGADIRAADAWDIAVGSTNPIIGIADTGVDVEHDDLAANIWRNPGEEIGDANMDGFPGVQGIDDDGDAGDTAEVDTTDFIDNDLDGVVDEDGIDFTDQDVMLADYNNNGIPLAGPDGLLGTNPATLMIDDDLEDMLLATWDDDENGYADDINGWDFVWNVGFIVDLVGHGTHVAGTVGAVGDNGVGVAGVSWSPRIMPLGIGSFFGIYLSAAIEAIEYAMDKGAQISNHSWGGTLFSGLMYAAVREAEANGHLMVCAAGNSGADNDLYPHYPASYNTRNIISVAASDHNDQPALFTCYGEETVDLAAPGVDILSTIPEYAIPGLDGATLGGYYMTMSGTSMSAPHVTGVAALLKSIAPWATYDMLVQAILDGVRPNPAMQGMTVTGGQLDAAEALKALSALWLGLDPAGGTVPAAGSLDVTVTLNKGGALSAGIYEAEIVVSQGWNSLRVPVTLTVTPAPVPTIAGIRIDDTAGGDGDGLAEPGETVDVYVTVRNTGSALLVGPTGTLSPAIADPAVSVSQPSMAWEGMHSGVARESTTAATIAFGTPGTNPVPFSLELTAT